MLNRTVEAIGRLCHSEVLLFHSLDMRSAPSFNGPYAETLSSAEEFLRYILTEQLVEPRDRSPANYDCATLALRCHFEKRVGRLFRFAWFAEQHLDR